MTARRRTTRSIGNGKNAARKHQIRVYPEGDRTEVDYLIAWSRQYRETTTIKIEEKTPSSPRELVKQAASDRKQDLRDARRGRGIPWDEYWCIIDVDEHPHLPEALQTARDNSIRVALSNPCLELWFMLHFESRTADIHRHEAQRMSESYLGCKKHLTSHALELLTPRFDDAKRRAQALDTKHAGDGSPYPTNPCTNVWELVESICRGTPRLP